MAKILKFSLGPIQTNCFIAACEESDEAAVIDPAFDGQGIAAALDNHSLTLTHILLTHAHFDHVGGLAELKERFPSVPVYIHREALAMLQLAPQQAAFYGMRLPSPPVPEKYVADGDEISVGTLRFEVLYTPGHAPGHVSYFLRRELALFSGDALFEGSIGRTDLPGGSYETLINAIQTRLLTLPDETRVFSGHGGDTTIGRERRTNPFLQ